MTGEVTLGIERLVADPGAVAGLRGRRVGLITNASAIDRRCRSVADAMQSIQQAGSFQLRALYAPEHGLLGVAGATERVPDGVDPVSGLPVFSLYQDSVLPTEEMVDQIDTFVFDVQDAGAIMLELEACRKAYGNRYIRISGFDSRHSWETIRISFIVNRPAEEPGFRLDRTEGPGRVQRYALHPYSSDKPAGQRYA